MRNSQFSYQFVLFLMCISCLSCSTVFTPALTAAEQEKPPKKESTAEKKNENVPQNPFPNRPKVPNGILSGGKKWLNTAGPISINDLKGKVVLLDFWTYCCINCIHVLPDLKYLEKKYSKELVVIGVHSAKFDNEKDSENIRRAVMRYEIEHPVVNDAEMRIWRSFGVRSWPSLALIDPEGKFVGRASGEGNRQLLDDVIGQLVAYHSKKKTLDRTPIKFALENSKLKPTQLRFPGKVLADESGNRLFIADSNHNRIVVCTLDGKLLDIIGKGSIGHKDGDYRKATFDHPQGMALVGETLYIADTENHVIRKVDLKQRSVSTLAGTGEQARRRSTGGTLQKTALNSPWDLEHVDGTLYIAMAGPHQIWRHELGSDKIELHAGNGREDVVNGPLLESSLAQPSGIATDGKFLYICDSEGSSIRQVPVSLKGKVGTLAGTSELERGASLFAFGDVDGIGDKVRLQHPLGIAMQGKRLFIADTYNQKIKQLDIQKSVGKVSTWLGDGQRGDQVSPPRFSDPAGLSIAGNRLYIADTNNHRICIADLKTGKVTQLSVKGLQPPAPQVNAPAVDSEHAFIELEQQAVKAVKTNSGWMLALEIIPKLPKEYHINPLYPTSARIMGEKGENFLRALAIQKRVKGTVKGDVISLQVPITAESGKGIVKIALSYGFCRSAKGGLCRFQTVRWKIPVQMSPSAKGSIISLTPPAWRETVIKDDPADLKKE